MPTILCSAIIAKLRPILLDPTPGLTWSDARLLSILSQAHRKVCVLRPEAYQTTDAVPLVSGAEQELPPGSTGLLDILRNDNGGRPCRQVAREMLDAAQAFRPPQAQAELVDDWTHDSRSPLSFVVSPPNDGNGVLVARYGLFPPDVTVVGQTIYIDDIYEDPLLNFALSVAYAEDTQRKDVTKVTFYDGLAKAALTGRAQAQGTMAPGHLTPPGSA